MEKIVVSDTNIFIDLISVDLLTDFFKLPWERKELSTFGILKA